MANWRTKASLGTTLKWQETAFSKGLFLAKMVVWSLGEVLSPIWQKLRSAASGGSDHSNLPSKWI